MFARLRRRLGLSPIAFGLVLAIGVAGSAGAAAKLITGKQIKDNSLTGKDVKDGSLLAKDFAKGQLPAGATGPAGPAGPTGPKGDPSFTSTFVVNPDADSTEESGRRLVAAIARARAVNDSVVWLEPGTYTVDGSLDLGSGVSLAGLAADKTLVDITPSPGQCGVLGGQGFGIIQDLSLNIAGNCGIEMRGSSANLRLLDSDVTSFGATGVSAVVRMPAAQQSLTISGSQLVNSGTGSGVAVVLGTAASQRVKITDSTLEVESGGSGSVALGFTGSAGTLALTRTIVRSTQLAVALSNGMALTSYDSHVSSTGNGLITAGASTATTSRLYGGSLSAPTAVVNVVDPTGSAVVRCYGVIDETAGGSTSSITSATCP